MTYAAYLSGEPLEIDIVHSGEDAISFLHQSPVAVLLLDIRLPDMSGLEVLKAVRNQGNPTDVIVITAEASVNVAVEAMRQGAFDFVVKPCSRERIVTTVNAALARRRLKARVGQGVAPDEELAPGRFMGRSPAMQTVYRILRSVAPTNANVFITGESGVGKELCAEALHALSTRSDEPFVAVNCAAIPKDLIESELFGHVKGAFTGATSDRKGAVLQAHGGTLFLDEIGEMDLALQAKLLRFLQEKTIQRVGEDKVRPADARIVCATNRDPLAEVAAGRFREDLYYRLHVVAIELPPLRDRGDDVLLIARNLLATFSREDGKAFRGFSAEAEAMLLRYPWPGNIRQLQNIVRSVVVLNEGEFVTPNMLPAALRNGPANPGPPSPGPAETGAAGVRPLEEVIREAIEAAIETCGSVPRAAAALKVSPSTLYRRLEEWRRDAK